jgi:hypothetical protein
VPSCRDGYHVILYLVTEETPVVPEGKICSCGKWKAHWMRDESGTTGVKLLRIVPIKEVGE